MGYRTKASLQVQGVMKPDLLPLPLLGFLWYGHPIDELLEDLGHATDETGIPMGLHRGLSAAAQLYPLVNRLRSGRF